MSSQRCLEYVRLEEIPYLTAQQRGAAQSKILTQLTHGKVHSLADVDFARAEQLINAALPSIG
jgi:hypothetical protein